jgi:Tol biopolymer transport system component
MKRCPECRRDYYDDGLLYCLEDGTALVQGPVPSPDEPATAIFSDPRSAAMGLRLSEGPSESKTTSLSHNEKAPSAIGQAYGRRHRTLIIIGTAILLSVVGYGIYRFTVNDADREFSFQKAKFTRLTTTGKASGVGISPDGKYVVHVQVDGAQQSLWTRQVATQSNVQIVAPAAVFYADSMTFSPDGNYVYYNIASQEYPDRALFQVSTLGGTPKKLLENVHVSPITFSPDGKQFAFARVEQGKEAALMIANADGSNKRKIVSYDPAQIPASPSWSPDGKRIAYVSSNVADNDATISEAQVADGSIKQLTEQRWLRVSRLHWLKDGSGLLMLATPGQSFDRQIWHVSYPDGKASQLTNDLNNYTGLSFAPGSGTLAVVQSETEANIWVAPFDDADGARQVTSGTGKADVVTTWTPDGRIVYYSNSSGTDDIWIIGSDGAGAKQLTSNARINQSPAVSPDGTYIVFHSDRSGVPHLWRMDMDGSDQRQLTYGASGEQNPQFSPDGRWLVYRTSFGKWTAWKIPAEGGDPVQLTDKLSRVPTVSPDGKMVAYLYRDENAPWRIALAPFDGGEPLKTFDIPPTIPFYRWTPDGRAIAYVNSERGGSTIFARPLDGGKPVQLTEFKADTEILSFAYSRDGKQLALSRGRVSNDVVLINNFLGVKE